MKTENLVQPKPKLQRCKSKPPKRIWIRSLQKPGMVSVAEYFGLKRNNIVDPFDIHKDPPFAYIRTRIDHYQKFNNNRAIVAVIAKDDFNAKHVADCLEIPIE